MGAIERAHASHKRVLKVSENSMGTDWLKSVDYATFCHNTSYHSSIGCTPSLIFHGRHPLTPIDLRFRADQIAEMKPKYDLSVAIQDKVSKLHQEARSNVCEAYYKYRVW